MISRPGGGETHRLGTPIIANNLPIVNDYFTGGNNMGILKALAIFLIAAGIVKIALGAYRLLKEKHDGE